MSHGQTDRAPDLTPGRSALPIALLITGSLLAGGLVACWGGPGVDSIRHAVEVQVPEARFEQEVHLRLGRMTTGLARWVANRAIDEDEDEARIMVNSVRRIEVAVFENRADLPDDAVERVTMPRSLERLLRRDGWAVMTEMTDAGSKSWVLVQQQPGDDGGPAIRGLYVVSLEADELAIVRLEGRFDEAFARVFADHPDEAADRAIEDAEG